MLAGRLILASAVVLGALPACGDFPGDPVDAAPRPDGADAVHADASTDAQVAPAGACKRGAAYNHETAADVPAFEAGIGWWYNWGPVPDADAQLALSAAGVEFVPMIWTGPPNSAIDVDQLVADIPAGSRYLLGFNEPNFGAQANLTPAQAAAAWPALEEIARARGLELVSPAVNYCGGDCNETDPFEWLDGFFAACTGCQVDYVAFHWYACSKDALATMLDRFEAYGRPVWLTEFSCLDSPDTSSSAQQRYMRDAVPLLEADPLVFRYAWFIARSFPGSDPYNLFGAPGTLLPLGEDYVGFDGQCAP